MTAAGEMAAVASRPHSSCCESPTYPVWRGYVIQVSWRKGRARYVGILQADTSFEAYVMSAMALRNRTTSLRHTTDLRSLMNVGPAVENYLIDMGVRSIDQLAEREPDQLFRTLQCRIGKACDPCLHDTFSAIIHEARTGEKTPWFAWTAQRKRRTATGELRVPPAG